MSVLKELKRRNVFKVGIAYAIVAWLIAQVAQLALDSFGAADWVIKTVLLLLVIGFPLALFFAWAFELTPEGVRREDGVSTSGSIGYFAGRKLDFLIIGMLVACIVFLVFDSYVLTGTIRESASSRDSEGPIAIAVLPFVNLSSLEDDQYFSDGLTDELQTQLTQIPSLKVLSRTSSFAFRGEDFDIPAIAKRLGVAKVLEGSVRRSNDRIRIAANLIDTRSDSPLWSETYDTEVDDIFEVQDAIAQRIVDALEVTLSPSEQRAIRSNRASNVDAYDYYLRGRYQLGRTTHEGLILAREMFDKAIEIDPDYIPAYTGLVTVHVTTYRTYDQNAEHLARADELSRDAVEAAPGLSQAHVSRGLFLTANGQHDEAEIALQRAVDLNPGLATAYYYYGGLTFIQGDFEKTAGLWEKALEFEPYNKKILATLPQVYRSLGRNDDVLQVSRTLADILQQSLEVNPDDVNELLRLATARLALGEREQALATTERVLELADEDAIVIYNAACLFSLASETEKAMDTLERSVEAGFADADWMQHDSDLDAIRDLPRFRNLLARMKAGR